VTVLYNSGKQLSHLVGGPYKKCKTMENVKCMNIKLGVYCSNKPDKKFLLYEAQ